MPKISILHVFCIAIPNTFAPLICTFHSYTWNVKVYRIHHKIHNYLCMSHPSIFINLEMKAQWIKFFIFRNSRLCSLWLKRNFLLLRRPFFLLLIFQNKKSWWVLKSTWKNLQNERNPTSVAQTVWFWDQKMWKESDFLVSAHKWLACDSAHTLEMIDDALELTRAWI